MKEATTTLTRADAYEVINNTQGLGDDFDKFLDSASYTVKNVEFHPVQIKDTGARQGSCRLFHAANG